MAARGRELLAKRPVELVPMFGPSLDEPVGEIVHNGAGLVRRPAEFKTVDGGREAVGGEWVATDRDLLPCRIVGIGVVVEAGAPAAYTMAIDGGVEMTVPGDALTFAAYWPPDVAIE
jgi:hypothetical protein